tara:strand:+ start:132 stop:539 length:408 start_codon:yes stop_codon:yes gene_type:complete
MYKECLKNFTENKTIKIIVTILHLLAVESIFTKNHYDISFFWFLLGIVFYYLALIFSYFINYKDMISDTQYDKKLARGIILYFWFPSSLFFIMGTVKIGEYYLALVTISILLLLLALHFDSRSKINDKKLYKILD